MGRRRLQGMLSEARDPLGRPRFYPAGEHPAAARWREQLAKLEAFRERVPDTPELLAAISHAENLLASFEAGEERAKRMYLAARSSVG